MRLQFKSGLIGLGFITLCWSSYSIGQQTSQHAPIPGAESPAIALAGAQPSTAVPGTVSGTVVDQSGAVVVGAQVILESEDHSSGGYSSEDRSSKDHSYDTESPNEVLTDGDGQFCFTNVTPGRFQLSIKSAGLATQTYSGILHSGEADTIPEVALTVATNVTEVQVKLSRSEVAEIAEEQLKVEEKQRVLGAIPNFYVSYVPNAAPLTSKQKFKLAARSVVDPFTFVVVAGSAGVEQWQNHFIGYGQGAEGYAKRFGAGYADTVSGTFIGGAILPSLLKQDPRYFYKGTGSTRSRVLYAIAMSLICKGDNGRWQPNYSNILGSLAAGGISNLYYPAQDRDGADLTFENAAIGLGSNAVTNLLQEFVIRKLTPKLPRQQP